MHIRSRTFPEYLSLAGLIKPLPPGKAKLIPRALTGKLNLPLYTKINAAFNEDAIKRQRCARITRRLWRSFVNRRINRRELNHPLTH